MATGFSPMLAFGSGLAQGAESVMAQKAALDNEYRKMALATSFEEQNEAYKQKLQQQQAEQSANNMATMLGLNKKKNTNQATFDSLRTSQNNTADNLTVIAGAAPTNTPVTMATAAPVPTGQIQESNLPAPLGANSNQPQQNTPIGGWTGGLNSPQGGNVPLARGGTSADATNPLLPPSQQPTPPVDTTSGTNIPTEDSDIVTTIGDTPLNRDQAIQVYGLAAKAKADSKGYLSDSDALATGFANWKDQRTKEKKTETAWDGSNDEVQKANNLGVPFIKDPQFYKLDAKTQFNIQQSDEKRLFGGKDEQTQLNNFPELSTDLKTLYELNNAITTGNFKALPGGISAATALDSYNAYYNKITQRLAILNRPGGVGGRMTNMDLKAYQQGFASLKTPNAANNSVILTGLAATTRQAEKLDYQKAVISANGRYDDAIADKVWNAYVKANPVLDMSDPINPKILPYVSREDWVRGKSTPDTNILQDMTSVTHNLSINEKPSAPPKVVTLDAKGNPQFDFSGF